MTDNTGKICLWFQSDAEAAARFYAETFPNSSVGKIHKSPADNPSAKEGQPLVVDFTVLGIEVMGLNGGPHFKFTEALSLVVNCHTQAEIDHYWNQLSAGGDPKAQMCGWLKDRYGLSWQIVPSELPKLLSDPGQASRVMQAVLQMKKIDIETLRRAADRTA